MQIKFNYVVFSYRIVDVHRLDFHNNQVLQYFHCHTEVMENHMNMNDNYYLKKKNFFLDRKKGKCSYRLSELSLKPLANGLLSILSCVTY
jgi:hypothetical protein